MAGKSADQEFQSRIAPLLRLRAIVALSRDRAGHDRREACVAALTLEPATAAAALAEVFPFLRQVGDSSLALLNRGGEVKATMYPLEAIEIIGEACVATAGTIREILNDDMNNLRHKVFEEGDMAALAAATRSRLQTRPAAVVATEAARRVVAITTPERGHSAARVSPTPGRTWTPEQGVARMFLLLADPSLDRSIPFGDRGTKVGAPTPEAQWCLAVADVILEWRARGARGPGGWESYYRQLPAGVPAFALEHQGPVLHSTGTRWLSPGWSQFLWNWWNALSAPENDDAAVQQVETSEQDESQDDVTDVEPATASAGSAAAITASRIGTPTRVGPADNLARYLTTGAWRRHQKDGREWAYQWLQRLAETPPPTELQSQVHLLERLHAAQMLRPAFRQQLRDAQLWLLAPGAVGAVVGLLSRTVARSNGVAEQIGPACAAGLLGVGEYAFGKWYATSERGGNGPTGVAISAVVAALATAAAPARTKARTTHLLTASAVGTAGLAAVSISQQWARPARQLFNRLRRGTEDTAPLDIPEGRASASDVILANFEHALVTYNESFQLPLPIAIAVTPQAFAARYPSLQHLADEVLREEWDTYHLNYLAWLIPLAPGRRAWRDGGADFMLTQRWAAGVCITQFTDHGALC